MEETPALPLQTASNRSLGKYETQDLLAYFITYDPPCQARLSASGRFADAVHGLDCGLVRRPPLEKPFLGG